MCHALEGKPDKDGREAVVIMHTHPRSKICVQASAVRAVQSHNLAVTASRKTVTIWVIARKYSDQRLAVQQPQSKTPMPILVNWLAMNSKTVQAGEVRVAVVGMYLPAKRSV